MSSGNDAGAVALRELHDRQEIETLIHRYCRSVDRIDAELGHSIFHPDATADYGDFYQGTGRGAIDAICESHRLLVAHSHQITTTTIVIDGNRAGSEAYHFAAVRMEAEGKLMQVSVWGRYLDTWSKRNGAWGIDHRLVVRDLDEFREVTPLTPGVPERSKDCPSSSVLLPGRRGADRG